MKSFDWTEASHSSEAKLNKILITTGGHCNTLDYSCSSHLAQRTSWRRLSRCCWSWRWGKTCIHSQQWGRSSHQRLWKKDSIKETSYWLLLTTPFVNKFKFKACLFLYLRSVHIFRYLLLPNSGPHTHTSPLCYQDNYGLDTLVGVVK